MRSRKKINYIKGLKIKNKMVIKRIRVEIKIKNKLEVKLKRKTTLTKRKKKIKRMKTI
jgi:hypothetical protein